MASHLPRPHLLAAILLVASLAIACGEERPGPDARKGPILVIGADGLEWRVILPMIRDGRLPELARLMREGVYGRLGTLIPTSSPMLWTCAATGKQPDKHGILGVARKDESGRAVRPYMGRDRRTKAIWNIFSDSGMTVHSIGWWLTYPTESITGIMVAPMNVLFRFDPSGDPTFVGQGPRGFHGLAHPEELAESAVQVAAQVQSTTYDTMKEIFGLSPELDTDDGAHRLSRVHWVINMDTTHFRLAEEILQRKEDPDLMLVQFRGPDVVGHSFWHLAYPEEFDSPPGPEESEKYSGVIQAYYGYVDSLIGRLLRASGPETTVLILSDHGMHADNTDEIFETGKNVVSEIPEEALRDQLEELRSLGYLD
jgi:predicted AlkP superfamily phosphohydrolase/phosphomutase